MNDSHKLIGIAGDAGAGKDATAAIILDELGGGLRIGLADPIKAFCETLLKWSRHYTYGPSEMREKPDPHGRHRADGQALTVRHGLRTLGVDWGRSCYPNIWIDFFLQRYRVFRRSGLCPDGLGIQSEYADLMQPVVVPDVRFANDAAGIVEEGGEIWRVVRAAEHVSERESEVDPYVSHIIVNDGTLEDLRCKIQLALVAT